MLLISCIPYHTKFHESEQDYESLVGVVCRYIYISKEAPSLKFNRNWEIQETFTPQEFFIFTTWNFSVLPNTLLFKWLLLIPRFLAVLQHSLLILNH